MVPLTSNTAHPLLEFVYGTFGEHFGGLLLAGYGEDEPPKKRTFLVNERRGGVGIDWVVEAVSDNPPRGEEPLVFAALLRLMLGRRPVTEPFYFEMADLMAELGWPDTPAHHNLVDLVIEKYLGLTFRKYEQRRRQRYKVAGARWGRYKLVSSYLVGADKGSGESGLTRTFNRLDFDPQFVRGLNECHVIFADMDFGLLDSSVKERTEV